jgi:hypothetical protein
VGYRPQAVALIILTGGITMTNSIDYSMGYITNKYVTASLNANMIGSITSGYGITKKDIDSQSMLIDPQELAELRDDSALLYALMDVGVEDWEKFGEALDIYREKTQT